MQQTPALFSKKKMKELKAPREKKEKRIYSMHDLMPVKGKYFRRPLSFIATNDPSYLEWWITTAKVKVDELVTATISKIKFLSL